MSKSTKSIPYYIVLISLSLILGSIILVFLWPIFEYGVVSIRVKGTAVGFYAPTFMISLFLLLVFIVLTIKIFTNRNIKLLTMIFALLSGISFIISLGYQSFGWTSYPPLAALVEDRGLTYEFFQNVFIVLAIFVSIIICIIIFLWFKRRSTAANMGLPKA